MASADPGAIQSPKLAEPCDFSHFFSKLGTDFRGVLTITTTETVPMYRAPQDKIGIFSPERIPCQSLRPALIAFVLLVSFLGGCAQLGPQVLSSGRPQYNIAVQETESQQLLLNIVRQRYRDPILFLDVTSISSGFMRGATAGISGTTGNSDVGSLLGGSISESPFITYAPNTGEAFVRQMMTPLDINTLALIVQAGWSIERTLLIVGDSINQLRNTPGDDNPESGYFRFQQAVSSLRDLQRDGKLSLGVEQTKGKAKPHLSLIVAHDAIESEPYRKACEALKVACDGRAIKLQHAIGAALDDETILLATRSLFSSMFFLSEGVDVPEEDAARGFVTRSSIVAGGPFDEAGTGESLFQVRSSSQEPEHAAVKVFYRNSWFYIADDDASSKVTFALVSMITMLQSGNSAKITPLITLPAR